MSMLTIYNLILLLLIVIIAYLHYNIMNLKSELKAVWLQISIVAAATAKEFTRLEEKNNKNEK